VEYPVGDPRLLRLIAKWLKAGVMEEATLTVNERGTPQGAVASPLLANIYLHYIFDLWAERWHKRHARGSMIVVRYADDVVCGFEHEVEARRFMAELKERFKQFDPHLARAEDAPAAIRSLCGPEAETARRGYSVPAVRIRIRVR
jgi:RNA-directed DNA polymerase